MSDLQTSPDPEQPPQADARPGLVRRLFRVLFAGLSSIVLLIMLAWCVLAIYYSNLFGAGWLAAFIMRPRRATVGWFLAAFAAVVVWWMAIPASNNRVWAPEYARMPRATIDGDRVTVHDIRDFDYRSESDFDVRYYDRSFDLRELRTMDFIGSSWGIPNVIHTLLSFGFADGDHLVLSVETRRELGEAQTTLPSLFKQYELIYVLGSECDLLRLRTNIRKENVYVFPTTTPPQDVRKVFLESLQRINDLYEHPRYYNLMLHNCTTSLVPLVRTVRPGRRFDWRFLLNVNTVQMGYDGGWFATPLSLKDTVEACHANNYVENLPGCEDYSRLIRPDLSAMTPK
jgi:hypothetical protein